MKYLEYRQFRYIELIAGLFWTITLPIIIALLIKQEGISAQMILPYICILILLIAAICILLMGINDIRYNKKLVLTLNEDNLEIVVHFKKNQNKTVKIDYKDIKDFCFVSDGTTFNKQTKKYEISPNSTGTISFAKKGNKIDLYYAPIYNALPAAKFILSKIDESQIDKTSNELTKDGKHTPKG